MVAAEDFIHLANSARDLARRLGEMYLDNEIEIRRQLVKVPSVEDLILHVEELLSLVPEEDWLPEVEEAGALSSIVTPALTTALMGLSPTPGLDWLALLRGVCGAALTDWYEVCVDKVVLERGDPFPLPVRPTHLVYEQCTAHFATTRIHDPLVERFNFGLYRGELGRVEINFECREQLDQACWIDMPPSFPPVGVLSPYDDGSTLRIPPDEVNANWWFGTGPTTTAWQKADILSMLRACKRQVPNCSVALLPELCLPEPNALRSEIQNNWRDIPDLVVLGSAHTRYDGPDDEVRANESVVYLRGVEILRHRKRHPYKTRMFGPESLREGITPESTFHLASGTKTRLGVLICADAMDPSIVSGLHDLAVNLVLVPALSPDIGSFSLAVSGVSSASQGVCVIVNGSPPGETADPLFVCFAGVPISYPLASQTAIFMLPDGRSRRAIGVVDLNKELSAAMTWL